MRKHGAQLAPVVAQMTGHSQATRRTRPYATTLSWVALCCSMHITMETLGMLGWAEQRRSPL